MMVLITGLYWCPSCLGLDWIHLFCSQTLMEIKPNANICPSHRYLDYGDAEWKQQANEVLKSLET